MKTMTITWTLPSKRTDGTALPVAEIKESEVALSSDNGTTWSVLGVVAPGTTQTFNKDLADGAYKVRILQVDTLGQRGIPAIGDVTVKTVAPPAACVITKITVA